LESQFYREGRMGEYNDPGNWGPAGVGGDMPPLANTTVGDAWQARGFPDKVFPVGPMYGVAARPAAFRRRFRGRNAPRRLSPMRLQLTNDALNARFGSAWTHGVRYKRILGMGGEGLVALCELQHGGMLHDFVVKTAFGDQGVTLATERHFGRVGRLYSDGSSCEILWLTRLARSYVARGTPPSA
jgi:hypothetical protein